MVDYDLHHSRRVGQAGGGRLRHGLISAEAEVRGHVGEQGVVEPHQGAGAAVVGVVLGELASQCMAGGEIPALHHAAQQLGVGIAETVDGLLDVADDKVVGVLGKCVGHQRPQVMPLHVGGVLELVDEQVGELHAEAFVDEWHLGVADYPCEEFSGVGNEHCVVFPEEFPEDALHHAYELEIHRSLRHSGENPAPAESVPCATEHVCRRLGYGHGCGGVGFLEFSAYVGLEHIGWRKRLSVVDKGLHGFQGEGSGVYRFRTGGYIACSGGHGAVEGGVHTCRCRRFQETCRGCCCHLPLSADGFVDLPAEGIGQRAVGEIPCHLLRHVLEFLVHGSIHRRGEVGEDVSSTVEDIVALSLPEVLEHEAPHPCEKAAVAPVGLVVEAVEHERYALPDNVEAVESQLVIALVVDFAGESAQDGLEE